jgi:uncharacterized protein (DUF58 family)
VTVFERLRRHMVRTNRIYIMPSGFGFLFLSLVVVLILTAATYNNNLIFLLAFFLFSAFIVSMLQTHYALKGVRLKFVGADDGFEGESLQMLFHIEQRRSRARRGLEVRTRSSRFFTLRSRSETMQPEEVFHPAPIEVRAWKRGCHQVPEMILETRFPLGLFRAWKVFRPQGELVVYPSPEGSRPLPSGRYEEGDQEIGLRTAPDGDFGELKTYQTGESYHQIAWKHYARSGVLYSKVHWGAEHKHYRIAWPDSSAQKTEATLRQMSRWIYLALSEDASFEMCTDETIPPGRGAEHARRCWRSLAAIRLGETG